MLNQKMMLFLGKTISYGVFYDKKQKSHHKSQLPRESIHIEFDKEIKN